MQLVLTALPQSICGMTLLGYYPVEEMVEIDLRATLRYANLPTLLFIFSSALMILPSIKAFNELMISQQVLVAVCF